MTAPEWTDAHEAALERAKVASVAKAPPAAAKGDPWRKSPRVVAERVSSRLDRIGALDLAERIADAERVSLALMLSRSREPRPTRARRRLIAILRWSTGLSLPQLGRLFGRDHTTILAAERVRERELAEEFGS